MMATDAVPLSSSVSFLLAPSFSRSIQPRPSSAASFFLPVVSLLPVPSAASLSVFLFRSTANSMPPTNEAAENSLHEHRHAQADEIDERGILSPPGIIVK